MMNIAGYNHNVAGNAGARDTKEAPRPALPPTEVRDGKEVLVVTRPVIVQQMHEVRVVRVDPAFFAKKSSLDAKWEKYCNRAFFIPIIGCICAAIVIFNLVVLYYDPNTIYLVLPLAVPAAIGAAYGAVYCVEHFVDPVRVEINVLCEEYGVDLDAGSIYEGPETLQYADLVYVPSE